jgi:hypothetical protein
VYLELAFCQFSTFLPFRGINKLRIIKRRSGYESHPLRQAITFSCIYLETCLPSGRPSPCAFLARILRLVPSKMRFVENPKLAPGVTEPAPSCHPTGTDGRLLRIGCCLMM